MYGVIGVMLPIAYIYWAFVMLPQKSERRRDQARATLGYVEITTATPTLIGGEKILGPTPTYTVMATATLEPTATPVPDLVGSPYKNQASEFCFDCEGYSVEIRYTHYWPNDGGTNCWIYNELTGWCESETASEIPWESAVNWGAACPYDWGVGTWIEVPYWGTVMCVDRGDMVCVQTQDGWLCEVDILAPSIGAIDGQILLSEVHIPRE